MALFHPLLRLLQLSDSSPDLTNTLSTRVVTLASPSAARVLAVTVGSNSDPISAPLNPTSSDRANFRHCGVTTAPSSVASDHEFWEQISKAFRVHSESDDVSSDITATKLKSNSNIQFSLFVRRGVWPCLLGHTPVPEHSTFLNKQVVEKYMAKQEVFLRKFEKLLSSSIGSKGGDITNESDITKADSDTKPIEPPAPSTSTTLSLTRAFVMSNYLMYVRNFFALLRRELFPTKSSSKFLDSDPVKRPLVNVPTKILPTTEVLPTKVMAFQWPLTKPTDSDEMWVEFKEATLGQLPDPHAGRRYDSKANGNRRLYVSGDSGSAKNNFFNVGAVDSDSSDDGYSNTFNRVKSNSYSSTTKDITSTTTYSGYLEIELKNQGWSELVDKHSILKNLDFGSDFGSGSTRGVTREEVESADENWKIWVKY